MNYAMKARQPFTRRFVRSLLAAAAASGLALAASATADDAAKEADHDHDHDRIEAGPTGGRLLTIVEPHAEFFVNADRKVEIRFVDHDDKVVAPTEQVITVIVGSRSNPTRLAFAADGDKLVSDKPVPEGNNHPTVVQIRESKDAKAKTAKFNLNMTKCPECSNAEYACTCDHDHD